VAKHVPQRTRGERFTARDYNALAEAANMVFNTSAHGAKVNIAPSGLTISTPDRTQHFPEPAQIAEAVNTGETDLNIFDAAQITPFSNADGDPIYGSGQLLGTPEFYTHRVLEICRPTEHCFGRFCICAENIPANRLGRVWLAGVCLARIRRRVTQYMEGEIPDRADTVADQTYLRKTPLGAAQVLAGSIGRFSTGTYFAVIRFSKRPTSGVAVHRRGHMHDGGVAEVIQLDSSVTLRGYWQGIVKVKLK